MNSAEPLPPGETGRELTGQAACDALEHGLATLPAPLFHWHVKVTSVSVLQVGKMTIVRYELHRKDGDPWPAVLSYLMPPARVRELRQGLDNLERIKKRKG